MTSKSPIIMPSLLSAPFSNLQDSLQMLENEGIRVFHYDVMDGNYVPQISFGPLIINSIAPLLKSTFDVHLMVSRPSEQIAQFDLESVRSITIHIETTTDALRELGDIHQRGKLAGLSVEPATPIQGLDPFLEQLDQILVMTVKSGLGGQSLKTELLRKVEYAAKRRDELGLSYQIQVDGGVNMETIRYVVDAGADEIVSGSAIFKNDVASAYRQLKALVLG